MDQRYRDPDWLEEQYHEKGLTQREIGEMCGVSARAIRKWMKKFEIPTQELVGENHPLFGKERTEETKRKISKTMEGREFPPEVRRRIDESKRGREIPDSVRKKISESLSEFTRPIETRKKMSRSTAGENNPNWQGGYSRR